VATELAAIGALYGSEENQPGGETFERFRQRVAERVSQAKGANGEQISFNFHAAPGGPKDGRD